MSPPVNLELLNKIAHEANALIPSAPPPFILVVVLADAPRDRRLLPHGRATVRHAHSPTAIDLAHANARDVCMAFSVGI
jgi:hypothetical protein